MRCTRGKFDDAIARGKKASELNQEYGRWRGLAQGLSSAALGRYDEAAASYRQLGSISGWKAPVHRAWRISRCSAAASTEAAAALEPVLQEKLPPQQHARLLTTLAQVRLAQGRSADAVKHADAALQASTDATTRFEAGRVYLAAGPQAESQRAGGRIGQGAQHRITSAWPDARG